MTYKSRPLAVITGASAGLGAAFARQLAARGYDLLLVARRDDRLQAMARQLADQYGVSAEGLKADLTDDAQLEAVARRILDAKNFALLINNAGFGTNHYFFETDPSQQVEMHKLHVVATTRLSHAAVKNLMDRFRAGPDEFAPQPPLPCGLINVSSVAAYGTSPQNVSYCSTKTWMNRFTEGLAIELGAWKTPFAAQALCPGYTLTEFHDVTGMDRSALPSYMWMTADSVVEASLAGFARRKLFVIPGWRYKALIAFLACVPGPLKRWGSIYAVQRFRRRKQV
ncbi:MAG: SDR family NAD(P)-dependent oxidoreductase [Acidobacteriota bacterium]